MNACIVAIILIPVLMVVATFASCLLVARQNDKHTIAGMQAYINELEEKLRK